MGIPASDSFLLSTQARPNKAVEAQAGQCVAEFPTQSQSWQRYADVKGMYCSIGEVMVSPIGDDLDRHVSGACAPFEIPIRADDPQSERVVWGFHKLREKPHCLGEHLPVESQPL
jgi:hypothetical protein